MGAGHGHRLHYHGHSVVHRLPAECKLLALVAFVLSVVAAPRDAYAVYAFDAALLLGVLAASTVPPAYIAKRMVVETPFLVFALLLPFIARGPRTAVLGVEVSEPGLVGAIALLAKGTLGVAAGLLLAATTQPREIVTGLERLRLPAQLVQITGFMIRYLDVVTDDLRRMRIARDSRGFRAGSPGSWRVLARAAGALFVRSYERGERVHLAMLARGYTGRLALGASATATPRQWALAVALPALGALATVTAWTLTR